MPHRTVAFMQQGFKELKCEPKKQGAGKRKEAQRFNLEMDHIDLQKAGQNNADGIRVLMEDLEKQFMEDPEFQQYAEETVMAQTGGQTTGGQGGMG